jgi:hypothetical protein
MIHRLSIGNCDTICVPTDLPDQPSLPGVFRSEAGQLMLGNGQILDP